MLTIARPRSYARSSRSSRAACALAALLGTLPTLNIQCGDEARRQFKAEAFPQIEAGMETIVDGDGEAGLKQILDGIISGILYTEPADTRFGTDGGSQ
jgi:hypothetical protein